MINDLARTTNNVEAWHKQFELSLKQRKPKVLKLIEQLRKEQKNVDILNAQLDQKAKLLSFLNSITKMFE